MRLAFLFPGQGMEEPWMGLQATTTEVGAALVERAACACGMDSSSLRRLITRGGSALGRTEVLQPLLAAVGLAVHAALRAAGVRPVACAGHSIGELSAWAAASGIAPETAIDLAALRGRLMARQAALRPGGMIALAGDEVMAARALSLGREHGDLDAAADNGPRQQVLAGDAAALSAVARAFPSRRLPVGGAWHGRAMTGALPEFAAALAATPRRPLECVLVANADGLPVSGPEGEASLPGLVAEQLTRPVQWRRTLSSLEALGITDFVTVGPGKVLRGLLRDNLGARVSVHAAFDLDDVARLAAAAAAAGEDDGHVREPSRALHG